MRTTVFIYRGLGWESRPRENEEGEGDCTYRRFYLDISSFKPSYAVMSNAVLSVFFAALGFTSIKCIAKISSSCWGTCVVLPLPSFTVSDHAMSC